MGFVIKYLLINKGYLIILKQNCWFDTFWTLTMQSILVVEFCSNQISLKLNSRLHFQITHPVASFFQPVKLHTSIVPFSYVVKSLLNEVQMHCTTFPSYRNETHFLVTHLYNFCFTLTHLFHLSFSSFQNNHQWPPKENLTVPLQNLKKVKHQDHQYRKLQPHQFHDLLHL